MWESFGKHCLDDRGLTIEKIYNFQYTHSDAYVMAGLGAKSLKGRSVELLENGLRVQFFPELWSIRNQMTDAWGAQYGVQREPIGER